MIPLVIQDSFTRLLILACLVLSSCSSFPIKKPEPPIVTVASVVPLNLSITQQKLDFKLKVFNPNPYQVPLESIDFVASLAGKELASGLSEQKVTLPAKGFEFVNIEVQVGINKLLGQIQSIFKSPNLELGYSIKGRVKVSTWPTKIPFNVKGEVNPSERI